MGLLMEALDGLILGLSTALTFANLFWVFVGVLAGTLVGVLPGLGPPATIAMLLPLTISLPPASGLIMMAGIYYGAKYGGSTTAILLNVPGESASVVTCLDGYEMAKQGRAGPALGIAAIASFIAGTVGVIGLAFLAPVVARWAIRFGPPEFFSLMALGLAAAIFLGGDSLLKGILSASVGLFLSTVGVDIISGRSRFTGGHLELLDGIEFIALSIGVFAIGEVLINVERRAGMSVFKLPDRIRDYLPSWQDLRDCRFAFFQSSIIGFVVGALPGAGSTIASFVSYIVEKRFSRHPEKFGKGAIEGVAAPEGANNSETGGAMIPLLTLGIPGSGTTAIMLGALILYGLQPGPLLFTSHPEIVWPIIASMFIGNVVLLILNLPLVPAWASILRLPYYVIYPGILIVSVIGVYSVNGQVFDVWLLAIFGLLGYAMRKLDIPSPPLVLAFVLGPLAERALRQSMVMSQNNPEIFLTRPLSATLLVVTVLMLMGPLVGSIRKFRKNVVSTEED
jgi:putative tricarboxylic transport membrane protein